MLEFILLPFIFVTTTYVILIPIKWYPLNFLAGLVGAGALSYLIYTQEFHFIIKVFIFLIELSLLIFFIYKWKNRIDPSSLTLLYLVSMLIVFFIFKGEYSKETGMKKHFEEVKIQEINYKSNYKFDVNNFIENDFDLNIKKPLKPQSPIIIYKFKNNKFEFDTESNQTLDSRFKSFDKDSIKTLVLLKNTKIDVGTYEHAGTIAQQIVTNIYFIDLNSRNTINSTKVLGSSPPDQVQYKITAPRTSVGHEPFTSEIINTIESQIK